MNLYTIRRRNLATPEDIQTADERARVEASKRSDRMRKIRSYVVNEGDGTLGSLCVYQATSPDALREHAAASKIPADEITEVAATDVARPDPEPAS